MKQALALPIKTVMKAIGIALGLAITLSANAAVAPLFDILLGRPTDHSIAVSVLATNDLPVYCEYGRLTGAYTGQTSVTNLTAGQPGVLVLDGLQANAQYYYRLRYQSSGSTNFSASPEHTFHTQRGTTNAFTFVIEADPHYQDPNAAISPTLWGLALTNMLADRPDFLIDLGDTFMDEKVGITTDAGVVQIRRDVRRNFFSIVGHSVPVFLANGNHDAELGWLRDGTTNNLAVWGAIARGLYYPVPQPGGFYSGSQVADDNLPAPRDGFYSFTWGNALFVILDPFWYTTPKPGTGPDLWGWTLGTNQYAWLQQTLAQSTATFKFVFLHHLVGGSVDGLARGGVELAKYGEWGGYNSNNTWGFATRRPGWAMPIQSLLLSNGVTAVFHGHDHLFVKQDLDVNGDGHPELIYQECPQPSATNYNSTGTATGYSYTNGVILGNSGHLRVTVTATTATVSYVRAFLPAHEGNGKTNRMVSYTYTLAEPTVTEPAFPVTIIPGRPTDSTLTLNVLAAANGQAYFEFGSQPGSYSLSTTVTNLGAGQPVVFELTGLPADTRCYYRLRFKSAGEISYRVDAERTFHTQRAMGQTFAFAVQSDSHIYDKKGDTNLYQITLQNIRADQPDFLLDLGDTFGDDHNPTTITYADLAQLHSNQRPFFDLAGQVAPLFLCIGNHEGETIGYEDHNSSANPICTYATQARLLHYPNPVPNDFYSGNSTADRYVNSNHVAGLPANYYAWEWGNALFVVLDAYRYLPSAKPANLWDWTLGKAQYDWLKQTLENSQQPYKFVFAHHVLGQTRGGVTWAGKYEWGGRNNDGTWGFAANRPGWAMPIHQLMVTNHVTIFFQGHDHLFAQEELDGIIYQEVPMPSDSTYHVGDVNADAFTGPVVNNAGHLRVTVAPAQVNVEYVRAFLPADEIPGQTNGLVAWSYRAASSAPLAASFTAAPVTGAAPLVVTFADRSTGAITNRSWRFGDGAATTLIDANVAHTYYRAGTHTVMLTVDGPTGSSTTSCVGFISVTSTSPPPRLRMPAVSNAILGTERLCVVAAGDTNLFAVDTLDLAGAGLNYQWQFGDGATSAWSELNSAWHSYALTNCGPYQASVTVSDGAGSTRSNLLVAVACELAVTRLLATVNFARLSNDTCSLTATLDLGEFTPTNQTPVVIDIGGAQRSFILDSKGAGVLYLRNSLGRPIGTLGTCRLTYNPRTARWTVAAVLSKGTWRDPWETHGLQNTNISVRAGYRVNLPVTVLIGSEAFAAKPQLSYTAIQSRTGTAR